MDENRFFKFVWRLNGIAIMLLLLFALYSVGHELIRQMRQRPSAPAVITNVAQDKTGEEKWSLGYPREIEGTDYIYVPLGSQIKKIPASGSGGIGVVRNSDTATTRNLLFVNGQTREMRWLFKGNNQLIENIEEMPQPRYREKDKVEALLYTLIRRDTNGDKKLTLDDQSDLAVSLPDGSHYKEIVRSVEDVIATMVPNGSEIVLLYQSGGKGYMSTIRLQDMSIQETKEIPKVD